MCVINSVSDIGIMTLDCVNEWTAWARSRRVSKAPRNSNDRKTVRDKVTSCTFTKIVINSTMTRNKKSHI